MLIVGQVICFGEFSCASVERDLELVGAGNFGISLNFAAGAFLDVSIYINPVTFL